MIINTKQFAENVFFFQLGYQHHKVRWGSKYCLECLLSLGDKRQVKNQRELHLLSHSALFGKEVVKLQHQESGSYKACLLLHAFAAAITSATNLIYRTL